MKTVEEMMMYRTFDPFRLSLISTEYSLSKDSFVLDIITRQLRSFIHRKKRVDPTGISEEAPTHHIPIVLRLIVYRPTGLQSRVYCLYIDRARIGSPTQEHLTHFYVLAPIHKQLLTESPCWATILYLLKRPILCVYTFL